MAEVIFSGPAGRIEGRFCGGTSQMSPVVLLLHPHPKQGGTMNNRVVNALFRTFHAKGFGVLKFNYRGVGRSEGVYDNGEGELSDAASALDWLQSFLPHAETYWVAGYSFGALLTMQLLMRRPELSGFVAVSPPANQYDFNFLAPCPVSGQIIQGDRDNFVNPKHVDQLVSKLRSQRGIAIEYDILNGTDHIYTDSVEKLESVVSRYIEKRMQHPEKIAS